MPFGWSVVTQGENRQIFLPFWCPYELPGAPFWRTWPYERTQNANSFPSDGTRLRCQTRGGVQSARVPAPTRILPQAIATARPRRIGNGAQIPARLDEPRPCAWSRSTLAAAAGSFDSQPIVTGGGFVLKFPLCPPDTTLLLQFAFEDREDFVKHLASHLRRFGVGFRLRPREPLLPLANLDRTHSGRADLLSKAFHVLTRDVVALQFL